MRMPIVVVLWTMLIVVKPLGLNRGGVTWDGIGTYADHMRPQMQHRRHGHKDPGETGSASRGHAYRLPPKQRMSLV
jgi:hypothetical protein